MAERILGENGSRRRRRFRFLVLPVLVGAVIALFTAGSALAVHDLAFQLDGDVSASTTTSVGGNTQSKDWDSFFDSSGSLIPGSLSSGSTGFLHAGFTRDFRANPGCTLTDTGSFCTADQTTFSTGSKDTLNITPGWQCNFDNNVNSKIDIMNAYAAAYTNPANGHQILYFALERNANTGDGNVAFWFLQDNANCVSTGPSQAWSGNHTDGDLLIVSAFTNGGGVSTIDVYRWNGGASGYLGTTSVAHGGDCKATAGLDAVCATTNSGPSAITGTISTPWLTSNKQDDVGHSLRSAEFFEGGLDLTEKGLGNKCFNVFVGDTRSSQSLTATLFDFARGSLGECTSTTETHPVDATDTSLPPGSQIPAAPADAKVDVKDKTIITVTGITSFSGSVSWHICGPTAASSTQLCDGTTGNVGVDLGSQAITAGGTYFSPTATVTAAGRYCFRAEFSGDSSAGVPPSSDHSAGECFTVAPRTPTISTLAVASPVDFGNPVQDNATLSGTAKKPGTGGPAGSDGSINPATLGGNATGTITFTLFKSDCTTLATGSGSNPQTLPVNGNGPYGPVSFTPDAPGTYYWNAEYGGDSPNTNAATNLSPCPSNSEQVIVRTIPTEIKTKQDWIPNDTATVTSTIGNLGSGGTVQFSLYDNATCSGSALYDETVNVAGGTPTETVNTHNTGSGAGMFKITTGFTDGVDALKGPFSWKVVYTPGAGDTAHTGKKSSCDAEHFRITYTNDPGPGSDLP